jgi:hypothetical protein
MRKRMTYANVAATLALVFSMTGGAIAANHYLITSTKQISPKVLKKLRGAKGKTGATGKAGATGKEGAAGKNGTNGTNGERGPSNAFNFNSGEDILGFPATAGESITVATLSLPAGSFAVVGKVLINNNAATGASTHCELLLGGTAVDQGFDEVREKEEGSFADRNYIALSGAGTQASAGSATISCHTSSKEGNYLDRAITAIQVGKVG